MADDCESGVKELLPPTPPPHHHHHPKMLEPK